MALGIVPNLRVQWEPSPFGCLQRCSAVHCWVLCAFCSVLHKIFYFTFKRNSPEEKRLWVLRVLIRRLLRHWLLSFPWARITRFTWDFCARVTSEPLGNPHFDSSLFCRLDIGSGQKLAASSCGFVNVVGWGHPRGAAGRSPPGNPGETPVVPALRLAPLPRASLRAVLPQTSSRSPPQASGGGLRSRNRWRVGTWHVSQPRAAGQPPAPLADGRMPWRAKPSHHLPLCVSCRGKEQGQ